MGSPPRPLDVARSIMADLRASEERAAQLRRTADNLGSLADRLLNDARELQHILEAQAAKLEG